MSKFADAPMFADEPKFADAPLPTIASFKTGTVAWVIQRYIDDMAKPDMNPLGDSHLCTLQVIQRAPISKKHAGALTKGDIIEFMRELKAGTYSKKAALHPATVNQYFNYWHGAFKHVGSAFDDCDYIKLEPFIKARPFLKKNNIVGKSEARTRRPTDAEITALLDYYNTPPKRGKKDTPVRKRMPDIIAFALVSTRRIGEICRMTHGDVDYVNKLYVVRDCKHPTKKKGNDKTFVLWPELEIIIQRQPRTTANPEERIFPVNEHSASASYINAKHRLGILDLRFHDNRGDACSMWLLKGMPPEDVADLISGHDNVKTLRDHYDRRRTLEIAHAKGYLQKPASEQRP